MGTFRPPADAWCRRDVMRNGMGSFALLCTLGTGVARRRGPVVTSAAGGPGGGAVRAVPARPADHARARAGPSTQGGLLRGRHPGGHGRHPARLPDADLRLRGDLPRADDPRAQGPDGDRPAEQQAVVRLQRPPARRLRAGGARRAPDGRHRARRSFDYKYPNDQDAAFLWYHDHAHGRTARTLYYGLVGTYVLARRARGGARPAASASTTSRS